MSLLVVISILFSTFYGCGASMAFEKGPLNLSGDQYWSEPLGHTGSIGMERLSERREGMIIDIPSKIYSDERRSVPLISLRTQSKVKAQKISLAATTQLVVTHLETGAVQVVKLERSPDIRDDGPVSKGWSNEWLESDIRQIVDLGPSIGRYQAWLVCGPVASNIRSFEIYPSKKAEHGGEVRSRISGMRKGEDETDRPGFGMPSNIRVNSDAPNGMDEFSLSMGSKKEGEVEIKLRFRIVGLEKYLVSSTKSMKEQSGKIIYARLPVVLIGFAKDHGLAYERTFLLPVVERPGSSNGSPLLGGSVSMLLHEDPEFRSDSIASVWATTLNYRSMLEIQPGSIGGPVHHTGTEAGGR